MKSHAIKQWRLYQIFLEKNLVDTCLVGSDHRVGRSKKLLTLVFSHINSWDKLADANHVTIFLK